jgi:hypothetical protein
MIFITRLTPTAKKNATAIARLTMMYKLVNGLVLVNTEDRLIPLDRISRNNNTKAYLIPSCRTETRKESYFPRTIIDWNVLSDYIYTMKIKTSWSSLE